MKQSQSLCKNGDFLRLYKRGKSRVHPLIVTYMSKNRQGVRRLGITTGKKIGGAVQRNRARRLIRAAFIELVAELPKGIDLVFVARTKTCYAKMPQIKDAMREHFVELGLLQSEDGR